MICLFVVMGCFIWHFFFFEGGERGEGVCCFVKKISVEGCFDYFVCSVFHEGIGGVR